MGNTEIGRTFLGTFLYKDLSKANSQLLGKRDGSMDK